MGRVVFPPLRRIPEGATDEDRHQMYLEAIDNLVDANPGRVLPRGVRRRWWHWKIEHPRTKIDMENEVLRSG